MPALSPYRVLDLTDARAELGPLILAGLGADVIKVEPPGGAASRREAPLEPALPADRSRACASTPSTAASAASCSISRATRGRADFLQLAASADFVFENAAPGAMDARGLGFDGAARGAPRSRLRRDHARSVRTGPYAHHLATDLTLAAMGGMMALNGDADRRPVRITVPQTWYHAAVESALARAGRAPAPARDRRGAVRRRVGAGGGLLDRPERDDRARDPGQEHRAQRHRAAAQHAGDAARLPVRRRRGGADRDHGDAARADPVDARGRRGQTRSGWRAEDWRTYEVRMLTGAAARASRCRALRERIERLLRAATARRSSSRAASRAASRSRR